MMRRVLSLAAVLVLAGTVAAQERNAERKNAPERSGDEKFLMEAFEGGMMEVKLGQVAQEQGNTAEVRQFGQRMVKDHTQTNKELLPLLKQHGLTEPKELKAEHRDMVNSLSKLKGQEFDRKYIQTMVKDHEEDVRAFEKESKEGKDETVRAFATKTLPTLREHLKMAKEIHDSFRGGK